MVLYTTVGMKSTNGIFTKLSYPPKLSARVTTLRALTKVRHSSFPPLRKKVSIPECPYVCRLANSCCGCDGKPFCGNSTVNLKVDTARAMAFLVFLRYE